MGATTLGVLESLAVPDAWQTAAFRITVLAGLAGVGTFGWKILQAVRAAGEERGEFRAHLEQTGPLILAFRDWEARLGRYMERQDSLSEKLGNFVSDQKETNREVRTAITALTDKIGRLNEQP